MKKTKGLVLSIAVSIALIAVPITVTAVLRKTMETSQAEIDRQAATSHRIPVEREESETTDLPFYEKYLPEIAGGAAFLWLGSIVLFVGLKKKKDAS